MTMIDQQSTAFSYIVSTMGVTGGRKGFSKDIFSFLQQTRRAMPLHPRFLGFGISSAAQVRTVKKYVDGVIVGSALIEIIRQETGRQRLNAVRKFILSLRTALDA
jgi:tryptophan synthase alpha chain